MINTIKKMIAKRAVKKLVKVISKSNPYALVAVEAYGLYDLISSQYSSNRKQ